MEVCIDSIESAVNAYSGGARRLELCCNLAEGGTTPTPGVLKVIKQLVEIPVFVMVRPRGGDFYYTDQEFQAMKLDMKTLKDNGADGFVIGMLHRDGTIDAARCQDLIDIARPLPVTFHRAIDMTSNIFEALEVVIRLGCERVLTSGGENTALEGTPLIKRMVERADGRIIVIPGGGITENTLRRVIDETRCREFHASARSVKESPMEFRNTSVSMGAAFGPPEYSIKVASRERVKYMATIGKEAL